MFLCNLLYILLLHCPGPLGQQFHLLDPASFLQLLPQYLTENGKHNSVEIPEEFEGKQKEFYVRGASRLL